jgi:hypothetical protein
MRDKRGIFFTWLRYLVDKDLDLVGQAINLSICLEVVLLVRLSVRLVFVFPAKL